MMMRVELIYNPASGTHNDLRLTQLTQAFEACGAQVSVGQTKRDKGSVVDPDADMICVSGGDGALRSVVAAMIETETFRPLCVFPSGTINLIARELGYASKPDIFATEVMRGFLGGPAYRLKERVVQSDDGPFVACLSGGPDGVAVSSHSPKLKSRIGKLAYAWSFAKLFRRWPGHHFDLGITSKNATDRQVSCAAFYVLKGRYFAGPWSLSPAAQLGSGQFQLLILKNAKRRHYLRFISRVARGRDPAALPFVESCPAHILTIASRSTDHSASAFQVDGDAMEHPPRRIAITAHDIEYCLPAAN